MNHRAGRAAVDSAGTNRHTCSAGIAKGGYMVERVLVGALAVTARTAWAGENGSIFFQSVPTLDEIGLGALIACVAAAAGWAVRRRSRR
ncbi:MAG TPA: IPTL-CTERM sorting domain-containing protein [Casimicrobiaceae bacterium]|nr:IPTL-CTERM sorting domain-containing protein [Casimicrobiaceae bacterium]